MKIPKGLYKRYLNDPLDTEVDDEIRALLGMPESVSYTIGIYPERSEGCIYINGSWFPAPEIVDLLTNGDILTMSAGETEKKSPEEKDIFKQLKDLSDKRTANERRFISIRK